MKPPPLSEQTEDLCLLSNYVEREGKEPHERKFSQVDRLAKALAKEINKLVADESTPLAEISILYTRPLERTVANSNRLRETVVGIVQELKNKGIPVYWLSRDTASRFAFDLQTNTVKLGSVYSSKGLDYDVVFLIDTETESNNDTPETRARHNVEVFVGATRARERLYYWRFAGE